MSIDPVVVPASLVPASLVPASLVPASLVPASLVPASLVPASLVPASLLPASPLPASPLPASPLPASLLPASLLPASPLPASPVSERRQIPSVLHDSPDLQSALEVQTPESEGVQASAAAHRAIDKRLKCTRPRRGWERGLMPQTRHDSPAISVLLQSRLVSWPMRPEVWPRESRTLVVKAGSPLLADEGRVARVAVVVADARPGLPCSGSQGSARVGDDGEDLAGRGSEVEN